MTTKKRRNPASRTVIYGEVEYRSPRPGESVVAAKTLANGIYKGVRFKVLMNHGMNPCAYISLTERQEIVADILDHMIHGGITFRDDSLKGDYNKYKNDGRKWIGWDYAHYGDYNPVIPTVSGKHWTTVEIVDELKNVIDGIKTVEKGQQSGQSNSPFSHTSDTSTSTSGASTSAN